MPQVKRPIQPDSAETGLLWPVLIGLAVVTGMMFLFGPEQILRTLHIHARSWGEGLIRFTDWH